jgi:chromate reductase
MDINFLAISGSSRVGSLNSALLELAVKLSGDGIDVDTWRAHDLIPRVDATRGVPLPPAVEELRQLTYRADGLLLVTPEFNRSIPGVLKDIVDWLSISAEPRPLADKPIILMSASPQRHGGITAQVELGNLLGRAGARVVTNGDIAVGSAHLKLDRAAPLADELTEQIQRVWERASGIVKVKAGSLA